MATPPQILSSDDYMNILVSDNDGGEVSEEQFLILVDLFEKGQFDYERNKALVI